MSYRAIFFILFFLTAVQGTAFVPKAAAQENTVVLAEKISGSLNTISDGNYKTIAFNHIAGKYDERVLNEIIDYTNVSMVRSRRFRVIDRTKLKQIIKEQIINTSVLITPDEFRRLGKILGVDLFLYGTVYGNTLLMKAIDAETSAIVWTAAFFLDESQGQHFDYPYGEIAGAALNSMRDSMDSIEKSGIKTVSFWNFTGTLNSKKLADFISLVITADKRLRVVDRENLDIILEEQKLSADSIIDQSQAKKIGDLYGIDGFIYGNVSLKNGDYVASLKLMNIVKGVIEWADLIILNNIPDATPLSSVQTAKAAPKKPDENDNMVFIPEGIALIGSTDPETTAYPVKEKRIQAFYMDKYEVSYADYAAFIKTYNYRFPKSWSSSEPNPGERGLPVVYVTWEDAVRYCEVNNKRLPTEVEWEYAYRSETGNQYPWGNDVNKYRVGWSNNAENQKYSSTPVRRIGRDISKFGVVGMAGNVREWTADDFLPYQGNPVEDPNYEKGKTIRGGSWARSILSSTGWRRDVSNQILAWPDVGFRCARDAP